MSKYPHQHNRFENSGDRNPSDKGEDPLVREYKNRLNEVNKHLEIAGFCLKALSTSYDERSELYKLILNGSIENLTTYKSAFTLVYLALIEGKQVSMKEKVPSRLFHTTDPESEAYLRDLDKKSDERYMHSIMENEGLSPQQAKEKAQSRSEGRILGLVDIIYRSLPPTST